MRLKQKYRVILLSEFLIFACSDLYLDVSVYHNRYLVSNIRDLIQGNT